jgi:hypothetical protein
MKCLSMFFVGAMVCANGAFAQTQISQISRMVVVSGALAQVSTVTDPSSGDISHALVEVTGTIQGICDGDQYSYELNQTSPQAGSFKTVLAVLATSAGQGNCSNQSTPFDVTFSIYASQYTQGQQNFDLLLSSGTSGTTEQSLSQFVLSNSWALQ